MLKIRLRKTDKLFTSIVRLIFNYTCQRCGKQYSPDGSLYNLGVSHYYGRSRENSRFLLDNVTLLCNFPCHQLWGGEEREDYKNYMLKRLGQEGFDKLTLVAHIYSKRDDKLTEIILKKWLEELKREE